MSLKTTSTFNIPSEQITDSTTLLGINFCVFVHSLEIILNFNVEKEQDLSHDNTLGDHLETITSQTPSLSSISSRSHIGSGGTLVPVETIKTVTPSSSFTSTPTQTNAQFSHPLEPTPSLPQVTSTHTSRAMLPTTTCYPTHFQKGKQILRRSFIFSRYSDSRTSIVLNAFWLVE